MKINRSGDYTTGSALVVGAGVGLLAAMALGRRRAALGRATRLELWQKLLARRLGTVDSALLAARVQARYEVLYIQRPRFARLALRLHLKHNLLPGLALYQALRETLGDAVAALDLWDEIVGAAEGSPAQKAMPLLGRVLGGFALFRVFTRQLMRHGFPVDGWTYEWVQDSPRRIAFNIKRCFYHAVLTHYGAPELTAHFCRLDDLAAEKLPPTVRWERTTTIGRGGPVCDFCWTYNPQQNGTPA
jgi:L-2-amino-thiazoline-4-carboxylic acid hydrolase-like protein